MSAKGIRAGSAFVEIFSDDTKLVRGLRGIEAKVKKTGASIGAVGSKVAGLGAGIASFGAVGIGALSWPLTLSANMEATETAFATMLKDTTAAKKLLGEVREFSASTPFQFPELANASKMLLAFGSSADSVTDELRMIGDIAAGVGQPIGEIAEIFGKARVQGRLFGEDINQLVGRGIPVIEELAKQLGVSGEELKKLVSEGSVNFGHLEKAFKSLTSQGGKFAGGMANQSKTLKGIFSTLQDNIALAVQPLGDALLPMLKEIAAVGIAIAKTIGGWVEKNKELVKPLAAALAAVVAIGGAAMTAGVAIMGLGAAVSAIGSIAGAVSGIVAAVGAPVLAVFAIIPVALGAIAAGYAYVLHNAGMLMPALNFLKESFGKLYQVGKNSLGGIAAALKSGQWAQAAKIAWSGIQVATLVGVQQVLKGIEYLWNNASRLSFNFFNSLTSVVAKVFSSLPSIAMAALRGGAAFADVLQKTLKDAFEGDSLNLSATIEPMLQRVRNQHMLNVRTAKQRAAQINGQRAAAQQRGTMRPNQQAINRPALMQPAFGANQQGQQMAQQLHRQTQLLQQLVNDGGLG